METRDARAIRHMYQSNFRMFQRLAFKLLHPRVELKPNWSIDVLGEALARCHRGETKRLIINMPPRSLKSLCASVALPAWLLAVQPEAKVMCVAGHRGLADEQHDMSQRLMTHPQYRSVFPHVRVQASASQIKLAHGGSRSAFVPTGALTGKGADFIIIDDPQSAHEASDPNRSEFIRNWFDRNIYQRLDDKADGVVILVMQRVAHGDLTAHLLDHGDWELLSLPAIAMEDEYLPASLGGGIARRKGEAMHPARESREQLRAALVRIGAKPFMAQYQQEPYPPSEGDGRGGAFHYAPHPDATEEECKGAEFFLGFAEEKVFVLQRVFGEETCLRQGPPPPMTIEEWAKFAGVDHVEIIEEEDLEKPPLGRSKPRAASKQVPPTDYLGSGTGVVWV